VISQGQQGPAYRACLLLAAHAISRGAGRGREVVTRRLSEASGYGAITRTCDKLTRVRSVRRYGRGI
jgi:hypothetical protein